MVYLSPHKTLIELHKRSTHISPLVAQNIGTLATPADRSSISCFPLNPLSPTSSARSRDYAVACNLISRMKNKTGLRECRGELGWEMNVSNSRCIHTLQIYDIYSKTTVIRTLRRPKIIYDFKRTIRRYRDFYSYGVNMILSQNSINC